jgi:hypothetical protein
MWAGMAGLFAEQRPVGKMAWMISLKRSRHLAHYIITLHSVSARHGGQWSSC